MEDIKITLARATIRILSPLIRILLRYEVSHSEFVELAKRSYVDVAYKHFSIPNRKKTFSRVSVITGLSRKEVVRLSKLADDEQVVTKGPLNRANRVISGWMRDPDFLDEDNQPRCLPLRGVGVSFESLAERYSGDITGRAILDELVRVGAVVKLDNQTVKLSRHGFVPSDSDREKLEIIATHAADMLGTGIHNISDKNNDPRFQRQVTYHDMPQHVIDEFQEYSHEKCLDLILEFDRWLAVKKESSETDPDEPRGRVGVGMYYFKNDSNENMED